MSTQNEIPSDIAMIIVLKKAAELEEQRQKEQAEKRKQEELEVQGKIQVNEFLQQAILKAPEWIRPYLDPTVCEPNYSRIATRWDRVENLSLYFSIPGLAAIEFDPIKENWRTQHAHWDNSWDVEEPELVFSNSSFWRTDVEFVLTQAREEFEAYEEYWKRYTARRAEQAIQREQDEQAAAKREERERKAEIQAELDHQKEQAEEQALFDLIKSDPIAMHMLKAFVFLRDERSTFEQRLYEADEAMSSMEGFWSNKASELRRQADDAQRRAEDEKSRIQSDLDYTKDELRKAEKAQRGW